MSVIYERKGIKLEHIDNYVYHKFTGLIEDEEWREGFRVGVEYVFKHGNLQWLNDLSDFWGTDCNNVIWLHDNVNDKVREIKGLKKIAFVLPDPKFKTANCNLEFYIEYSKVQLSNSPVCIVQFPDLERAEEWVKLG